MKDWLSLSSLREMKTSLLSGYEFDHVSSRQVKIIVAAGKFGLLRRPNASHVGRTTFRTNLEYLYFLCYFPVTYLKSQFQSCFLIALILENDAYKICREYRIIINNITVLMATKFS